MVQRKEKTRLNRFIFAHIMSFEQFQLTKPVLENLYPHSLVVTTEHGLTFRELNKQLDLTAKKTPINPCIVIGTVTDTEKEAVRVFLEKMLTACKLDPADALVLIKSKEDIAISSLFVEHQPSNMMIFGVATEQLSLPASFPEFRVQVMGSTAYVLAPPIQSFFGNDAPTALLKKELWGALKKMFQL